jgi:hypothetical protein
MKPGSRLQGIVITLLGLVLGYFSIVQPLLAANSRVDQIAWLSNFAFLSPPFIILGILATIFPSMTTDKTFLLKSKDSLSLYGWVLVIVMLIIGFGTYYLVNQQFAALGYHGGSLTDISR